MVSLDTPDKSGTTRRRHLERGRAQFKKIGKSDAELAVMFAELQPVKLRYGSEYFLNTFAALSNVRAVGMNGPLPVTYHDIKAYSDLMGVSFAPWEVEILRAIDAAFLDENYKLDAAKE